MTVRTKIVEYVLSILERYKKINLPYLIGIIEAEFGVKHQTAVDVVKSIVNARKARVELNNLVLAGAAEDVATSQEAKPVEEDDKKLETALLGYLKQSQQRGEEIAESGKAEMWPQAKYIVVWDVELDKINESERRTKYRRLKKILLEGARDGRTYEWINKSVILSENEELVMQVASIFEDCGKVRVFKVVE